MESKRERENRLQRERRKSDGNKNTKKYEKTKKGFLVRCYRNMKSRIEGVQVKKHHLYKGKYLLSKELFYEWSLNNENFNNLFNEWEISGYNRKTSPSIDRIDNSLGYDIENMQWITHSENSRKGAISRNSKVITYHKNYGEVARNIINAKMLE